MGGIERTNERKLFLRIIPSRDAETLQSFICKHVRRESIITTDHWKGYLGIERYGYTHLRVNHSENFVDPENSACTNTIEGTWNGVKSRIAPRNRTTECDGHLMEFIWRRVHEGNLWNAFIGA